MKKKMKSEALTLAKMLKNKLLKQKYRSLKWKVEIKMLNERLKTKTKNTIFKQKQKSSNWFVKNAKMLRYTCVPDIAPNQTASEHIVIMGGWMNVF